MVNIIKFKTMRTTLFYGLPRKSNCDSALIIDKAQKIVQDTMCAATLRLFYVKWLCPTEAALFRVDAAGGGLKMMP